MPARHDINKPAHNKAAYMPGHTVFHSSRLEKMSVNIVIFYSISTPRENNINGMRTICDIDCHRNQNPRIRRHYPESRTSHYLYVVIQEQIRISHHTVYRTRVFSHVKSVSGSDTTNAQLCLSFGIISNVRN